MFCKTRMWRKKEQRSKMSVFSSSTELSQQHVYKEEDVLMDQQRCSLEMNCSLDHQELEPPQIKEEQEEPEAFPIKEEYEEPEPPWIKVDQEKLETFQIKEEQEEPEPPQIKEEQEELCISQDLEQMGVMLETDTIRVIHYLSQLDGTLGDSANRTMGCEEEMDHENRLLDINWKPVVKLHRISMSVLCDR
ncbi:rho GTPase-activating protein gacV-like isoform X3 [Kryptolebias marmoratus]|uniref:rho GTPase-activating protein gacV-like isoform X3 n=1 Tax=Kryptolebias marmoratus TaxID=37003 RepID=UPI0007F9347B|nr:rho GTPase-activating protein gacV-like isoform X3 [Kryptolebias marmoratus]